MIFTELFAHKVKSTWYPNGTGINFWLETGPPSWDIGRVAETVKLTVLSNLYFKDPDNFKSWLTLTFKLTPF